MKNLIGVVACIISMSNAIGQIQITDLISVKGVGAFTLVVSSELDVAATVDVKIFLFPEQNLLYSYSSLVIRPGENQIIVPLTSSALNKISSVPELSVCGVFQQNEQGTIKSCFTIDNSFQITLRPLYPFHKDVIDTRYPQFAWLSDGLLAADWKYRLYLFENKDADNYLPSEPILVKDNISLPFFDYPLANMGLVPGLNYLWYVEAYTTSSLGNPIRSDTWSFSITQKDGSKDLGVEAAENKANSGNLEMPLDYRALSGFDFNGPFFFSGTQIGIRVPFRSDFRSATFMITSIPEGKKYKVFPEQILYVNQDYYVVNLLPSYGYNAGESFVLEISEPNGANYQSSFANVEITTSPELKSNRP